ncbi:DUF3094 family protein [Pseudomonas asturiensis]|uniref:DUF3094 family protein n=1 Tax=Pseudomonas asturiensis TaxID=1190415 RepID=A0ABX6HHG4_9PSED|nr:DUF3094 family protein [Pseudomonas asturiensis]QHF05002.1 DUF3094 family protein [Pseudomonas asturiensis]
MSSRLNPDDQRCVEEYLQAHPHHVERRPFQPWLLLIMLVGVVIGLALPSRFLSHLTL